MINAGIVGLGWWGSHILSTVQGKSDKLKFVSAVEPQFDETSEIIIKNDLKLQPDLDTLLKDANIDAVVLATPHSLHEEQICSAAAAGKHVFCEKPLALTKESAQKSINMCEKAGVVLGVGHERRFEASMREIKELISIGVLGEIMHVEANFSHDMLSNLPPGSWRVSETESPAAGMTATGIHLTDAYINMFGKIKEVYAATALRNPANQNGDILSFHLKFESGVTGYFNSVLETPLYIRFCLFGTKGWVEAKNYHHPSNPGPTYLTICKKPGEIEEKELDWEDSVLMNFEAFADACLGNQEYPFSNEEKIQNIEVFEAICLSARKGNVVVI